MADSSDIKAEGVSQNTEQLVKLCKRRLENWREVLIHLNSVLVWEKPYYPGITAAVVSLVFLIVWYFDPSFLTTVSIFGIFSCLLDFLVPMLSASFFDSSKWTGNQEKKYEEICRYFVEEYLKVKKMYDSLSKLKESKPYLYVIGIVGSLILAAWIGNLVNNLFLTYLSVLFIALSPGIQSQKPIQDALASIQSLIGGQTKKKK